MESDAQTITTLVRRMSAGDGPAADELWRRVYDELHAMARTRMARERVGVTLQPTALVHEVWVRVDQLPELRLEERAQFFLLAGKIMRSVLVDAARARDAEKRGGDRRREPLTVRLADDSSPPVDYLELDAALRSLEDRDPGLARLVELRFFAGRSHPECAEALGQSLRTVERNWRIARVWLHSRLH